MFRRVLYENWHDVVPIVAFVLTFAVFVVAFIRALLMRKDTIDAMALLPLDDKPGEPASVEKKADVSTDRHESCQGNCPDCGCSRTQ